MAFNLAIYTNPMGAGFLMTFKILCRKEDGVFY